MFVQKSAEEFAFTTLNSHAKFEEKLTSGLENDMRNMANFHQSTYIKVSKLGFLWGSFYPKKENV